MVITPNWTLTFEIICGAYDFIGGAVLGQPYNKNINVIYYAYEF